MRPTRHVRVGLSESQQRQLKYRSIGMLGMWSIGAATVPIVGWMGTSNRIDLVLALALIVPIALLLLIPVARWVNERRHREALAEAGLICPQCGYSMQGLDETVMRCPECGHPRERRSANGGRN